MVDLIFTKLLEIKVNSDIYHGSHE